MNDTTLAVAFHEVATGADVAALVELLTGKPVDIAALDAAAREQFPAALKRESAILTHPVFNSHHSENRDDALPEKAAKVLDATRDAALEEFKLDTCIEVAVGLPGNIRITHGVARNCLAIEIAEIISIGVTVVADSIITLAGPMKPSASAY